ncbi:melatonin receptor type 1B-A-like [Amphiura filiformis]|uniref:melatonin receptor type 1B-A-like n=1 Tax=Amphiura filiformis TaxID=82378 RepID=UPI003B217112
MDNTNITSNSADLNVAYWEQIFTAVIIILIAIAGIFGNSMVITAVALSRKLQTATNAFVTSLGVSDLLTSFFLIWYAVGALGRNSWPIPGAYWLCQTTGFMIYASVGTSLYTLAAIAINRLIHITRPDLYQKIFSSWKLGILVAIPWIIPIALGAILLLSGYGAIGYNPNYRDCADLDTAKGAEVFQLAKIVIGLPVPCVAIVASYIGIYVYMKKHFRRQKRSLSEFPARSTDAIHNEKESSSVFACELLE